MFDFPRSVSLLPYCGEYSSLLATQILNRVPRNQKLVAPSSHCLWHYFDIDKFLVAVTGISCGGSGTCHYPRNFCRCLHLVWWASQLRQLHRKLYTNPPNCLKTRRYVYLCTSAVSWVVHSHRTNNHHWITLFPYLVPVAWSGSSPQEWRENVACEKAQESTGRNVKGQDIDPDKEMPVYLRWSGGRENNNHEWVKFPERRWLRPPSAVAACKIQ